MTAPLRPPPGEPGELNRGESVSGERWQATVVAALEELVGR